MATTSTVPSFRTALKALLEARPNLAGVQVFKYMAVSKAPSDKFIEFTRVDIDEEYRAMNKRTERYMLRVTLWHQHKQGGDDAAAEASETAALGYADEIREALIADPTVSGTVTHAQWMGGASDTEQNDSGRWTEYEGAVEVIANL